MKKSHPGLQTECSATQQFLLSKTRADTRTQKTEPERLPDSKVQPLSDLFPHVQSGKAFITHALNRLEALPVFGTMVLQIDAPTQTDRPDEIFDGNDGRQDTARAIDKVCNQQDGMWGLLDGQLFGCFFPDKDEKSCFKIAETIMQTLSEDSSRTVTIGIAVFPTLDFNKGQIIENAQKTLDHAKFFGPDSLVSFDAISLNISGDRFYDNGDIRGAVEEFKKALLLDPSNTNVHNSLGVCYGVQGKLDKALEEFKAAMALDADEALAMFNAGLASMLTGNRDEALEYFLKTDDRPETRFEVAIQTGRLYLEENAPEKSRPYLEKAAGLCPESCTVYSSLGECYTALDMTDEAVTAYKKAIRLNSNDAASLSGLGWLYSAQGKNPEIATLFCKQSVEIAPENGLFRQRLGRLYFNKDRLQDAMKEFQKATELGFDSTEYMDQIQHSIAESGD